MENKKNNEVAAFRYGVISPVIYSTRLDQKKYFQEMAKKTFDIPGAGKRKYKWRTFKHWLKVYRKSGIEGLMPKQRNDCGISRRISSELSQTIVGVQKEYSYLSNINLYRLLLEQNRLPYPPISVGTLHKFLKDNGLLNKDREPTARKKYEAPFVNDLWVADFLHGPRNLFGKKSRVYLLSIIDDHSRMIVGCRFFIHENIFAIEEVFKKAILTYGLPKKFYCDNGAPFSSNHLQLACAKMLVALIHSKPYDSPSRGKIERFFRTFRAKFLNPLPKHDIHSIDHLNELTTCWINNEYHRQYHTGIDMKPIDRYMDGIKKVQPKTISAEQLDLYFYQTVKRNVKNDATISVNSTLYEVPPRYIGKKIELRFPTSSPNELTIYEQDKPVCKINPVDVHKNSETSLGIKFSVSKNKEDKI